MKIILFKRNRETWTRIRIRKCDVCRYAKTLSGIGIDVNQPDQQNRIYLYWDRPGNLTSMIIGWDLAAGTDMTIIEKRGK